MINKKSIGLIIPFYNEQERLDYHRMLNLLKDWPGPSLLVNDGSTDLTLNVLKSLSVESGARVLSLEKNAGKALAVRKGLQHMLSGRHCDWLCVVDSDFSVPEDDIFRALFETQQFYARWNEGDLREGLFILSGSRLSSNGVQNPDFERHPVRDRIGRFIRFLTRAITFNKVMDPQTPLKIYKCNPSLQLLLSQRFRTRWFMDVELMIFAKRKKISVDWIEISLKKWIDVPTKNYSGVRALFVVSDLLGLLVTRFRK